MALLEPTVIVDFVVVVNVVVVIKAIVVALFVVTYHIIFSCVNPRLLKATVEFLWWWGCDNIQIWYDPIL